MTEMGILIKFGRCSPWVKTGYVSHWSKMRRVSHEPQSDKLIPAPSTAIAPKSSYIVRSVSMKIMAEASAGELNKPCSVVFLAERQTDVSAALSPSAGISDAVRLVDRLSHVS